mgnify:FL=1
MSNNPAKEFGMRYPSIDKLLEVSDSKYKLAIASAIRAKQIQELARIADTHEGDVTLIETTCVKSVGRALEEIISGKVRLTEK